jgi:hypothetical protein
MKFSIERETNKKREIEKEKKLKLRDQTVFFLAKSDKRCIYVGVSMLSLLFQFFKIDKIKFYFEKLINLISLHFFTSQI